MEIAKTYNPAETEDKWYKHWLEHKFFASKPNPNKQAYTIVIPPPNVTGILHMGHILNNTIQDILIRKKRMQGFEACWVPGTDHASIATEARVVAMLKERGIDKREIGREEFLKYAWEWKEKYGGIILSQLQKLGASCDWDRTAFTMDPKLSESVIKVFVDLYAKGKIYRGYRMGNWDPEGQTALADDEVIHKEIQSKLYYVSYPLEGENGAFVTIATTRPETILGDSAICVNPEDERFKHLIGKKAIVPFVNRAIPIIGDEYVEIGFGTGCLKVTPAHDHNDHVLGLKHGLEVIDILTPDGKMNETARFYVGQDRAVARKNILKDLDAAGFLVKTEEITHNVGFSERTNAVVEPRLSLQWYVSMKELCAPALENVMNDTVRLYPPKFKNTYKHWMENVRDWCISRQLWWGQRIPAYYLPDGSFVVAATKEEAFEKAFKTNPALKQEDLKQDEDVLDTWFSSALWPISVFDGINEPDNEDIKYYYPTNDLVTAPEILFFWVARMIISGYEYRGQRPFENVYLTGIVRDKLKRKMSKSLGNSPDPLELIAKYGADGIRTGMLFSSPAGNDLLFDEKLCEQGRNFCNKTWNAFRLVAGWETDASLPMPEVSALAIEWFKAKFDQTLEELEDHYEKYRMSDALLLVYKLIWDDFCANFLEMVKPAFGSPIDTKTLAAVKNIFEGILKVLHPFMPFITEEIWHLLAERAPKDCLVVSAYPLAKKYDKALIDGMEQALEIVANVRNLRNLKQISPKTALELQIKTADHNFYGHYFPIIEKLANLSGMAFAAGGNEGTAGFVCGADEFFVPLEGEVDMEKERENLIKELQYTKGFLAAVEKKLSNERFVGSAPDEVVGIERKKKEDAENKIKALEASLSAMA